MPRTLYGDSEKWDSIKADVCSGKHSLNTVAKKWKVSVGTIKSKSYRENWPTPAKVNEKRAAFLQVASDAVVQGLMVSELNPNSEEAKELAEGISNGVVPKTGNRLHSADPLDYQTTMAKFAMALAMEGVQMVPKPRNLREVALADTIARRALGLDSKGGGGGTTMIRINGQAGTVDVATTNPVDVGGAYDEADDESDWDE